MPSPDLRASDADRDRTASALHEGCSDGRLTLIGFSERVALRASPERCRTQALEFIAPLLARWDYRLVARGPDHLGFELEERPAWTILVAVFAFPLGLIALMVKRRERIDLEFVPRAGGGTDLLVAGKAPRAVRRAFLELRD